LLPWVSIFLICFFVSWYSLLVVGLDVLLAPVLKLWLLLKPLLFKTLPALLLWLWILLGGWKAWSAKKLARQGGRFFISLSARFVAVSVLLNLLFGHERRGVKSLPRFVAFKLRSTRVGRGMRMWTQSSAI